MYLCVTKQTKTMIFSEKYAILKSIKGSVLLIERWDFHESNDS